MPEHRRSNRVFRILTAVVTAVILMCGAITPAYASEPLDDTELLARLVWLEARGEPDEGQQAVVAVVLNRLADGSWGGTLSKVIFASGQFSPALAIPHTTPTEKEYANVQAALDAITPIFPAWVMYFRADRDHNWNGYEHYTVIGGHWFGGFRQDRLAYERVTYNPLVVDVSALDDSNIIFEIGSGN